MCFACGGMQQTIDGMSILFWPVWPAECCQADKCLLCQAWLAADIYSGHKRVCGASLDRLSVLSS